MPNSQYANLIALRPKTVHREIARLPHRYHQFAEWTAHLATNFGMDSKNLDRASNRVLMCDRGVRILFGQKIEQAVEILQGLERKFYLRQGLGMDSFSPLARRSFQA